LAQAGSSFLLIIATYLSVFVGLGSAVFIQVGIMSGSGCEDEIVEANATAYRNAGNWTSTEPIFNPETWICSKAESALASTAAAESVCEWLSAILLALITFLIGRRRGYFKENGCSLLMYFKNKEARAIGSEVLRSHAGVAVRSILFNTMEMLSAAVSLGIGVTAAAVFNFFGEIGSLSYSVPNLCAVGAMMIGPRLLGQNRIEEFRQLVNLHRIMAIIFAVAFTLLAFLTSEISITDEFTNEVDSSLFGKSSLSSCHCIATFPSIDRCLWTFAYGSSRIRSLGNRPSGLVLPGVLAVYDPGSCPRAGGDPRLCAAGFWHFAFHCFVLPGSFPICAGFEN